MKVGGRRTSDPPNRALTVVRGYLVLPHAVPILVVLVATGGFALIASHGHPNADGLVRLLVAMLGAQLAIGAANELVDADLDAQTKPDKPIPSGLVSRRGATTVALTGLLLMVGLSASFGWLSLFLCTVGTAIGIAYSLWFKRTRLAWLPYILALPLLPIWVWTAFDRNPGRMLLLYPLGIPAIFSIYLSQSLPDIAADRLGGVRNLPVLLGERRTLLICWGAMLGSAVLLTLVSVIVASRPVAAWGAACLAVGLVACNVFLYTQNRRQGIRACFPCMAVAGAGLGVGWVLAITS